MTATSGFSPLPLTIGVTGHRDIKTNDIEIVGERLREWFLELSRNHPHTPLRLLSGLAEGADRIAARVFLDARDALARQGVSRAEQWELVAVLPMAEEAYRDDFPDTISEFEDLKAHATAVIALPGPTVESIRARPQLRLDGYEALGRHLIRHSNILAALWDGSHLTLRGGTSHVVRLKLEGYSEATSGFSIALHDCGPVWHLPVGRVSAPRIPDDGSEALPAPMWVYPQEERSSHGAHAAAWRAIDKFNRRSALVGGPAAIRQAAIWLSPSKEANEQLQQWMGPLDRRLISVHAVADALAMRVETERLNLMRGLYLLGAALAICLWTGLDNVLQLWMAGAYAALVMALFFGVRRIRRSDLSEDPLSYRFLAEALRVQLYWSIAHATEARTDASSRLSQAGNWEVLRVLDALLSQQAQEIGWVREALRIGALNPNAGRAIPEASKRAHIEHWIGGQLSYFTSAERRHERRSGRIERESLICAVLAILCATGVVVVDALGTMSADTRHIFAIAAAVLPAIALLLQSYSDRLALEEQQKSSVRMRAVFTRAQRVVVGNSRSVQKSSHLIRALGQEALTECAYWFVLRKSKPAKIPQ